MEITGREWVAEKNIGNLNGFVLENEPILEGYFESEMAEFGFGCRENRVGEDGQTAKRTEAMKRVSPSRRLGRYLRDKRIAMLGGVCYLGATIAVEGWLSGLKRRFAKPLYGQFFGETGQCSAGSMVGRPGLATNSR
jgi:hypothetical protein